MDTRSVQILTVLLSYRQTNINDILNNFFIIDFEQTLAELLKEFDAIAYYPEANSEPCQTSRVQRFAKAVNGLHSLTAFAKHSILDV